jgi:alkylation response protein AidB-like acyl-CoA dehydrogenase
MIDSQEQLNGTPPQTAADALERAVAIARRLPERWTATEQLRRVPDDTMADLRASGLLRINQPARFGGPELGVEAVLDVGSALAAGDVSVAWAYVILASHEWIIGLFPDEAQQDIWSEDPTRLMSSAFAPSKATVTRVDGGWRLQDGTWPWSSGSDHADWAMVGFRVPPAEAGGPAPVRWAVVPRGEYTVGNDWMTVAAHGTGSNTLTIVDAFVPDHRTLDPILALMGLTPGAEVNTSPLFRSSFNSLAVYLAAPILGGARAAVKHFTTYMESKQLIYTGQRVGTEGPMLVHLGEVAAKVGVAETVLRATARQIDHPSGPPDPSSAFAFGRDCTFAVRLCADAVDETMRYSGASAIFEGHQANKWWRDVRALSAHQGFNTDMAYGNWGRFVMGMPPAPGPFG